MLGIYEGAVSVLELCSQRIHSLNSHVALPHLLAFTEDGWHPTYTTLVKQGA